MLRMFLPTHRVRPFHKLILMLDRTDLIRHFLSTLAYRFYTATGNLPTSFGTFDAGAGVRTPNEIIRHLTHLMIFTQRRFVPDINVDEPPALPFEEEVDRFYRMLHLVDQHFVNTREEHPHMLKRLLQGPLSDAMTHIGQLAMLARLFGHPIPAQSFSAAAIESGKLDFRTGAK